MLLAALLAYSLGSLSPAHLVTRARLRRDIRALGSGNAGALNVAREVGPPWGLLVLLLDAAKGAGAVGIGAVMASVPVGRARFLLGVYASRRLNVHLLPILVGLCLMAVRPSDCLARAALGIGYLLCHASWPDIASVAGEFPDRWTLITSYPLSFTIGCVIVGFVCNWTAIGVLFPLFRVISVNGSADSPPTAS